MSTSRTLQAVYENIYIYDRVEMSEVKPQVWRGAREGFCCIFSLLGDY